MGALSKTDYKESVSFFHLGLPAWHAELLRVYSSQRLSPIGVQKLETHHSFPPSEDMVRPASALIVRRSWLLDAFYEEVACPPPPSSRLYPSWMAGSSIHSCWNVYNHGTLLCVHQVFKLFHNLLLKNS